MLFDLILFYFILFYFILFYFILFYFILFYFILFYFILFYFILFYFILFYFILFYFILSYLIFILSLLSFLGFCPVFSQTRPSTLPFPQVSFSFFFFYPSCLHFFKATYIFFSKNRFRVSPTKKQGSFFEFF